MTLRELLVSSAVRWIADKMLNGTQTKLLASHAIERVSRVNVWIIRKTGNFICAERKIIVVPGRS